VVSYFRGSPRGEGCQTWHRPEVEIWTPSRPVMIRDGCTSTHVCASRVHYAGGLCASYAWAVFASRPAPAMEPPLSTTPPVQTVPFGACLLQAADAADVTS